MSILQILFELLFCAGYISHSNAFPAPLSAAEERAYIERMRAGDEEARIKLIEHNLRLVAHIARKFIRAGRDGDDIVSIGSIGLIKAVSTFDPDKGASLSSYAGRCVENEILMSIRAQKKQAVEVSLTEPLGQDGEGNDVTLSDVLGSDGDAVPDAAFGWLEAGRVADAMRGALTPRERTVISLRFGLCGNSRLTQQEIAAHLGISRSYISRIEKKAMRKLGAALQGEGE